MKRLILFFIILLNGIAMSVQAQPSKIKFRDRLSDSVELVNTAIKPPKVKPPKMLRGELSGGLQLNTSGWGVLVDYGRYFGMDKWGNKPEEFSNVHLIQLEIGEIKHPKEMRNNASFLGLGMQQTSYILGKINTLYHIKLGYGQRRLIAGKPEEGAVSIHWVYAAGFAAGLVKPYYLNISGFGNVKYSKDNEEYFINPNTILGASGFAKGFNELQFVPGGYLKTGLHFDFANRRKTKFALEAGVNGEFYTKKIEQMVGQDPKNAFGDFYLTLQVGKKW